MSLAELRTIAQPPEYSPARTDHLYRVVSIYLSIPLANLGITPNAITVAWILIGLAGIICLGTGGWIAGILGALLLELSYLLDFVDGEVARLSQRRSDVGRFLDFLGHGLIRTALPLGVAAGAVTATGTPLLLLAGAVGAIAIGVGGSIPFYSACTTGDIAYGDLAHAAAPSRTASTKLTFKKAVVGICGLSFESPGLYALALLGATAKILPVVSLYWMVGGTIWLVIRIGVVWRRVATLGGTRQESTNE